MKGPCLNSDIINTLPQDIIEMILTLMPIRDAVRTSILSRKWRYNWVKIPKLVFDLDQFEEGLTVSNQMCERLKFIDAINQVMLVHEGPILEFTLKMHLVGKGFFEIDQIILLLSRKNTLMKFTLDVPYYKLPSSFYSLQRLTHLYLNSCKFQPPSTFNGFDMVTSLTLNCVEITEKVLLRLVSGCPKLKHFALLESDSNLIYQEECSIVQLFKCLNVIEHLDLTLYSILLFFTGGIPQKLPSSLVHLKHLDLYELCLMDQYEYSFTLFLIRSSPNLEKIKIEIFEEDEDSIFEEDEDSIEEIDEFPLLQDYADVRLDYLVEFEIDFFSNSLAEMELLKLILVKSPVLKKVHLKGVESDKNEIKTLRSFLIALPRASPFVDIIVQQWSTRMEWL